MSPYKCLAEGAILTQSQGPGRLLLVLLSVLMPTLSLEAADASAFP